MQKKIFKRGLALAIAVVTVFGSSMTVFANPGDETIITGNGEYAGDIIEAELNVMLPTQPVDAGYFDYTMDPERVLDEVGAFENGNITVVDNTGVYFFSNDNGNLTVSSKSKEYTVVNKSRVPINLTVAVDVDDTSYTGDPNADKIVGVVNPDGLDVEAPSIYLAVQIGQKSEGDNVILPVFDDDADNRTETMAIEGVEGNFEVKAVQPQDPENPPAISQYQYTEIENPGAWKAVDIFVEGAINQFDVDETFAKPVVEVTWSYDAADVEDQDYEEYPNQYDFVEFAYPTVERQVYIANEDTNANGQLVVNYNMGDCNKIVSINCSLDDGHSWVTNMDYAYSVSDEAITFTSNYINQVLAGDPNQVRVWRVIFEDVDGNQHPVFFDMWTTAD